MLKQQLSGRALVLIDSLEIRNQTYNEAKNLLNSAFASRDVQVFKTIKNLTEIKLKVNDDPYVFVSKMKNLTEFVTSLNITSEQFLQYFFGMVLMNYSKIKLFKYVIKLVLLWQILVKIFLRL